MYTRKEGQRGSAKNREEPAQEARLPPPSPAPLCTEASTLTASSYAQTSGLYNSSSLLIPAVGANIRTMVLTAPLAGTHAVELSVWHCRFSLLPATPKAAMARPSFQMGQLRPSEPSGTMHSWTVAGHQVEKETYQLGAGTPQWSKCVGAVLRGRVGLVCGKSGLPASVRVLAPPWVHSRGGLWTYSGTQGNISSNGSSCCCHGSDSQRIPKLFPSFLPYFRNHLATAPPPVMPGPRCT